MPMAIFSRRSLYKRIIENAATFGFEVASSQAKALDAHNPQSLDREWEVVVLNALARVGHVEHESLAADNKRLDIVFRARDGGPALFSADIVAASDKGIDEDNPIEGLRDLVSRIAKKEGIQPHSVGVSVDGERSGSGRTAKMRAKVPRGEKQITKATEEIHRVVQRAAAKPSERFQATIEYEDVLFRLSYQPSAKYGFGRTVAVDHPISLQGNPLYSALKRKAVQLKKAKPEGLKGIIVCDGGTVSLGIPGNYFDHGWSKRIVAEFLRVHTSVMFVTTIFVDRDPSNWSILRLRSHVYVQTGADAHSASHVRSIIKAAVEHLPPPINDAGNALEALRHGPSRYTVTNVGAAEMSEKHAKVSAAELLRLLAGRRDSESILEAFARGDPGKSPNPFSFALAKGLGITAVTLERNEEFDDDWIVFHFGPDAAGSTLSSLLKNAKKTA